MIDVSGQENQDLNRSAKPLDILTEQNLQKAADARAQARQVQNLSLENQFVTARNAQQLAAEAAMRTNEENLRAQHTSELSAQESSQRINQAKSDAEISRDNAVYAKAQAYKIPTHDDDGKLIPTDELNQNIADAAGKQAAAIHAQIANNNSKLAGMSVPLPDIQAAAQAAARNVANNPLIAAQVKPDTMAKVQALVAAQGSNPLGLANLIYSNQHGIGSYSIFGGGKDAAQAAILQSALAEEMDKQIAAQTNVKSQQAMFQMKAVAQQNEVLAQKYEQYFTDSSPETQAKLLSPDTVTNSATGGNSAASNPATYVPQKIAAPSTTPTTGAPTSLTSPPATPSSVPPSPITQHFQQLSQADDAMTKAQQLAQRLTDLTAQKQGVHQKTMPGATQPIPFYGSPGPATIPAGANMMPVSNAQKAQYSGQEDAIDAQIADTQSQLDATLRAVKQFKSQALGVPPAASATAPPSSVPSSATGVPQPSMTPTWPPPQTAPGTAPATGQPTSSVQPDAIKLKMRQLAAADGVSDAQMQQGVLAAQAGNPQAIATIRSYYQRATNALGSQNNPFAIASQPPPTGPSPTDQDQSFMPVPLAS